MAQGEQDLVEDLKLAKKVKKKKNLRNLTPLSHLFCGALVFLVCSRLVHMCVLQAYHDPMLKLSIMTEQELTQIFGTLDSLIPLHEGRQERPTEVD